MRRGGDTDNDTQVDDFLLTLITIRPLGTVTNLDESACVGVKGEANSGHGQDGNGNENASGAGGRQFQIPVESTMTVSDLYDIVFSLTDIAPDELTLVHEARPLPRSEQSLGEAGITTPTVLEYGRIGDADELGSTGAAVVVDEEKKANRPGGTSSKSSLGKQDETQATEEKQGEAQNRSGSANEKVGEGGGTKDEANPSEARKQQTSKHKRAHIDTRKLNNDMKLALGQLLGGGRHDAELNKLFINRLRIYHAQTEALENANKQATALKVMPPRAELQRRMAELRKKDEYSIHEMSDTLAMTKVVLQWFKHECFQWVDKPSCWSCPSTPDDIQLQTVCAPSSSEVTRGAAARTEVYGCAKCGAVTRFPRYEDPEFLLQTTKRGRCGEWAKAFGLCVRSLGIDGRMVHDWTDHVWVEVWCDRERRWVHADACEDIMDEPLLYEKGWGKKLTYVIATARDCMVDVTKRYTLDFESQTCARRHRELELGLAKFIDQWNRERWSKKVSPSAERERVAMQWKWDILDREKLTERYRKDKADAGKRGGDVDAEEHNLGGRQSGSAQWVKARGEDGSGGAGSSSGGGG